MNTVLGLLGFIVYLTCAIGLAAGLTFVVIKVLPTPGGKKT